MEAADGFSNVSKTELLRGVVVEKLTAAAQEILAVVERTVACYEEEASGLRQEIDRQRRQLENLLQPRIKLETIDDQFPVCELAASLPQEEQQHKYESNDQFPVCEPAAGGGAELVEEEEQHKYEMRVEDSRSLGLMCYTEAQMEEEEDQEPLTEPDYQVFSRLLTPTVESDRRSSAGKPRVHALQDHIDLRIHVLEDSLIKVVSADMFKKYAMQEVKCPRGLQEADFLDLLRSTFPQLADRRPFDFFTADKTKRLQPVRVKPLTPEEIDRHISSTGHSALYIRLKDLSSETDAAVRRTQEALKSTELLPRSQTNVAAPASPPPAPDQTRLSSPRVKSDRRKPGRPRTSERQNHVDLRIRILEDSQLGVLSPNVFQMCPVLELQCPRGLQEADFLHLLRSTFPQLAARRPFDFFTIDRTKTLQPLRVETRTPEEIHRAAGHSALYIRLKPPEEIQTRDKGPLQKKDAATCSPSIDQTKLYKRVKSNRISFSRPQTGEPQNLVDLRIFILEDSQIDVLSCSVYKKYAVQALQCPGGLREADFLDLLRSTFPQLAAGRPFDFFTTDKTKKLQPLRVKPLTPEEINRHIRSTGHSALYIRLKAQEEVQISEEELHRADADKYSSSTSDQTRLNTSNPVQSSSSTSQHEDMKTEEADNEDGGTSESAGLWSLLVLSDSEGDRDDVSADDWEPNKSEKRLRKSEPKRTKRKRQTGVEHSAVRTMTMMSQKVASGDGDALSCKVCCALRGSMNMLIKHACSHVADPERLCGVCGEHSESAEELRNHLQSHQKTHSCHICGKSFLSTNGLSGHVARHRGHKPHMCKICHKSFTQKWVLKNHMWTHAADKPHKCDLCPKSFVSKVDLTRHRLTHMRESLHRCDACGESFSSFDRLSKHTSKHSGHTVRETKSACGICSKAFKTRRQLQVHMRVHVTSKPYKCSVCEKAFSYNQCVKRHMKTQHGGPDLCKTEASVQIPSSRINGTKSVFKRVR